MRRALAAAALLVCALGTVRADTIHNLLLFQQNAPILDLDFTTMSTLPPYITFSRASTANDWVCTSDPPVMHTFAIDEPMLGVCDPVTGARLGWGIWDTALVGNKDARDLTTSNWTRSGTAVAVKDQTGVDGVANSASSLTASGANASACIFSGTNAKMRAASMFIKRLTGTGRIGVSQDGINWTYVQDQILTTAWRRVPYSGHYQSFAGARVCVLVETSGDAIAVDGVNGEDDRNLRYAAPSPVIYTGSVANSTRDLDFGRMSLVGLPGFDPNYFVIAAQFVMPKWKGSDPSTGRSAWQMDEGNGDMVLIGRTQTDPPNPPCYNTGMPPGCVDVNVNFAFIPVINNGKVRCSNIPNNNQAGLVPPGTNGEPETFVFKWNHYAADQDLNSMFIVCNPGTGAGNVTQLTPGGDINPPLTANLFKRLVFGRAPSEARGHDNVGMLNGYLMRLTIFSGGTDINTVLATMSSRAPLTDWTYILLPDGTPLAYETGTIIKCNKCAP